MQHVQFAFMQECTMCIATIQSVVHFSTSLLSNFPPILTSLLYIRPQTFLDQFCFWAVLLLQVNVQLILISNLQNVSVIFQLLRSLHRSCKYGEDEDCIGKPLMWLKSGLRISPLYLLLFAFLPFSTFTFCPNITWLRTKWFFLTVIPSQKLHNFVMARY